MKSAREEPVVRTGHVRSVPVPDFKGCRSLPHGLVDSREQAHMPPTTVARKTPAESREESIPSYERARSVSVPRFAGRQSCRAAQLAIRETT